MAKNVEIMMSGCGTCDQSENGLLGIFVQSHCAYGGHFL